MGNAFMPSVASSLNDAGQKSLLDVMQQRILQAEMQKLLFTQQRQQGMDAFNIGMRLQDQQQQERDFEFRQSEARRRRRLDEDEAADKQWAAESRENALISAANMPESTSLQDRRILAQEAGAPMTAFDLPEKKEPKLTLGEKVAERKALRIADKEIDARFDKPKAEKIGKDDPQLPARFRSVIRQRRGTKGFETYQAALQSLGARWHEWLQNYPELDASKVKSELDNIYGPRATASGDLVDDTK